MKPSTGAQDSWEQAKALNTLLWSSMHFVNTSPATSAVLNKHAGIACTTQNTTPAPNECMQELPEHHGELLCVRAAAADAERADCVCESRNLVISSLLHLLCRHRN